MIHQLFEGSRKEPYSTNRGAALLFTIFAVIPTTSAFGQGCASCYTTTAAGGSQTINALRSGILVLLVPPVIIFLSIMFVLLRWRRARFGAFRPVAKVDGTQ